MYINKVIKKIKIKKNTKVMSMSKIPLMMTLKILQVQLKKLNYFVASYGQTSMAMFKKGLHIILCSS